MFAKKDLIQEMNLIQRTKNYTVVKDYLDLLENEVSHAIGIEVFIMDIGMQDHRKHHY